MWVQTISRLTERFIEVAGARRLATWESGGRADRLTVLSLRVLGFVKSCKAFSCW